MTRALLLLALAAAAPAWAEEDPRAPRAVEAPGLPPAVEPVEGPVFGPNVHGHVMFELGGIFHELYAIPYGTASLTLRFGADYRHLGIYGEVMGEAGAALPRLPIENIRAGFQLHYVNGRFRVGGGVRLGGIIVGRATGAMTDTGLSLSMYAMGSVDLVRWKRRGIYLGVEVGFDFDVFAPNAQGDSDLGLSPLVALQLGFRL